MGAGAGRGAQLTVNAPPIHSPMTGDFVDLALSLAGAEKSDLICVSGPAALPAAMRLCLSGFENVECAWRATCVVADRPRDLLLLAGAMDRGVLGRTAQLTSRLLRDGGLLVAELTAADDASAISPALAAVGRCGVTSGAAPGLVAMRVVRRRSRAAPISG